jgi:hypothetical protein
VGGPFFFMGEAPRRMRILVWGGVLEQMRILGGWDRIMGWNGGRMGEAESGFGKVCQ